MTNEEAFEQTLVELEQEKVRRYFVLKGSKVHSSLDESIQYLEICAMAIKKQIPKKPVWIPHDGENDWYDCPTCGKPLSNKKEHHCVCGQTLCWEGV